jgi:hypothetical protein
MGQDQCSKIDKVGRKMAVCHLPLHHPEVIVNGKVVRVHKGLLDGTVHEWQDDDDLPPM